MIEDVLDVTAKYFRVEVENLMSESAEERILMAKSIAMYLCYKISDDYRAINQKFGEKNSLNSMLTLEKLAESKEYGSTYFTRIDNIARNLFHRICKHLRNFDKEERDNNDFWKMKKSLETIVKIRTEIEELSKRKAEEISPWEDEKEEAKEIEKSDYLENEFEEFWGIFASDERVKFREEYPNLDLLLLDDL